MNDGYSAGVKYERNISANGTTNIKSNIEELKQKDYEPYLVGECGTRPWACGTMKADLGCCNERSKTLAHGVGIDSCVGKSMIESCKFIRIIMSASGGGVLSGTLQDG